LHFRSEYKISAWAEKNQLYLCTITKCKIRHTWLLNVATYALGFMWTRLFSPWIRSGVRQEPTWNVPASMPSSADR
jgi:hypothetical protein